MRTTNHIDSSELQALLDGQVDVSTTRQIEEHIQHCIHCRQRLEQLAADPQVWQRASTVLADDMLGDTIEIGNAPGGAGVLAVDALVDAPIDVPGYSVTDILDKPSHPEMLGRLEDYEVEREIGRGGMGIVLKAHDNELNRPIAIKIMAPHLAANGAARKRFAREARAAAAVLHPNVIAIHSVDSAGQIPYLVMPYIAGQSLQQVIDQNGPLDEKDIVRVAMQIAAGLAAAHSQGLVHRDIKPANVLIEHGISRVLITDFGLARAEDDVSMTQTGWFAGTPNFMSPEQSTGSTIDGRSDLFSLGSVMYFMATGHIPFRAEQPMAVLERIRNDSPTPMRQVNSDVSRTLADLIDRLLEKSPGDRFQSAADVHQVLEQYLAYLHRPDSSKKPVIKPARRKSKGWVLPLAAAGIILVGIGLWMRPWLLIPGANRGFQPEAKIQSLAEKYQLTSDATFLEDMRSVQESIGALNQDSIYSRWADEFQSTNMTATISNIAAQLHLLEQQLDTLSSPKLNNK